MLYRYIYLSSINTQDRKEDMGFWNIPPLIWGHLWCTKRFQPLMFEKDPIPHPVNGTWGAAQRLDPHDVEQKKQIRDFLRVFFGTPPISPELDIPEEHLVGPLDVLFYVSGTNKQIIGCIRYHPIGQLQSHPMYLVDCFCIHPQFRKQGLADYLLTTLHCFANKHGIPYALFLKEGAPLPVWSIPLYTGSYVYRQVRPQIPTHRLQHLTPEEGHCLLDTFCKIVPNTFVIRPTTTHNQSWRLYRESPHQMILACVQDSFQWLREANGQRKKMGWFTAWLESPSMTDDCRAHAITEMADSMEGQLEYVWANKAWIGSSNVATEWKEDGSFHWYAYQWNTNLHLKSGYCIVH